MHLARRCAAVAQVLLALLCRVADAHQVQGWHARAPDVFDVPQPLLSRDDRLAGPEPTSPTQQTFQTKAVYGEANAWPVANVKGLSRDRGERETTTTAAGPSRFKALLSLAFSGALLVTCTHKALVPARACGAEAKAAAELANQEVAVATSERLELAMSCLLAVAWMAVSVTVIMFNKWLFTKEGGNFPYPLTLAAMHMGCCFVVFGIISWLPRRWRGWVMPDVDKQLPLGPYLQSSLPVAILYALGVGFGDLGFMLASVSFNLFVKPANVVWTTLAAFAFKLEVCTSAHVLIVMLITLGVAIAASSGVEFSMAGFVCQMAATATEGLRLVLIQRMCQCGMKLDPITTLYRFAPFTGLLLCILSFVFDGPVDWAGLTSPGLLALNCGLAVVLNVLIVGTIARTSAMVFVMCGVLKDIVAVMISSMAFRAGTTPLETVGYGLSLVGICTYKAYKSNLALFMEHGLFGGFRHILFKRTTP